MANALLDGLISNAPSYAQTTAPKTGGNSTLAGLMNNAPALGNSEITIEGNKDLAGLIGIGGGESKGNVSNWAVDGVSNVLSGVQSDLVQSLAKKVVPTNLFNVSALGVGQIGGWCGTFASTISTASKVGDYWGGKIDKVDKREGIKAGDKIAIPLGVTGKPGAWNGYGHMMAAITPQDENGNFVVAQSNADGRQERGEGPGVVTLAVYNVNDLNKRYKTNWGAISGELKINPYANEQAANQIKAVSTPKVQTQQSSTPNWAMGLLNQGLNKVGEVAAPLLQTSAKAPPGSDKADLGPEALAKYVLDNNITNLQNYSWWKNSPVKGQAWDIISQVQGKGDPGKRFSVDQGQTISQGEKQNPFLKLVTDALRDDPIAPGATSNFNIMMENLGNVGDSVGNAILEEGRRINQIDPINAYGLGVQAIGKQISGTTESARSIATGETPEQIGGLAGLIFNVAPGLAQATAGFNVATSLPVVGEKIESAANYVFAELPTQIVENTPGLNQLPPEIKEMIKIGLPILGGLLIHKGIQKAAPTVKAGGQRILDDILYKKVPFDKSEVFIALQEINGVPGIKANPKVVEAMKDLINSAVDGVKQKKMLQDSYKNGIKIKEARNFTKWFNDFFKNATKKDVTPEFQKLLTDGKKVMEGKMTPIEFVREARQVMAKGETATIRDNALAKIDPRNITETQVRASADLNALHNSKAQEILNVTADNQSALTIKTFQYSDGKIGIGYQVKLPSGDVLVPISGSFPNAKLALEAILPDIQKIVSQESNNAAEAIRSEIDKLKGEELEKLADKAELAPWDDGYIKPEKIDVKSLNKEEIQGMIEKTIDDYIKDVLAPGMKQGVTPGSLSRDIESGDVIGRSGRQSNNAEWYRDFYRENGRAPGKKELRDIAVDHLLNGVEDSTIGSIPPNKEFTNLIRAERTAVAAKPVPKDQRKVAEVKGTGKVKTRGVTMSVRSRAVANLMEDSFGDLPEYKTMKKVENLALAQEIVDSNPSQAKRIAMGQEAPPKGILPESVFKALEMKALLEGDVAMISDLATKSGLITEATEMGRRLGMYRDLNSESPIAAIKEVLKARDKAAAEKMESKSVAKEKTKVKKEIEKSIKKSAKKESWEDFISSLECSV
jgi:hypothetical protein